MSSLTIVRNVTAAQPLRGVTAARWYARFFRDPVACMAEVQQRFGNVLALGNVARIQGRERLHVLALGPEANNDVLGNPSAFHNTGQGWRGRSGSVFRRVRNGMTRYNGEKHQQHRQLLLPLFLKKAVDGYAEEIAEVAGQVLDEQWHSGQTVEMYGRMRNLAMRMSTHLLFGRLEKAEAGALSRLIQEGMTRTFSAGVWLFPFDLPLTPYRRMRQCTADIEQLFLRIFQRRRASPSRHTDMISIIVRAFDEQTVPMNAADLVGQATTLFVASYENIASSLTWTNFLLAQHPDVMAELYVELIRVLGDDPPTIEKLNQLPLLDAVIKESMRILPPVPFLTRKVEAPAEVAGLELKPRDRVVCSPYVTHHMPEIFPEPERFLPHRWFHIRPGIYDYLPFGAGSRACFGKTFAMTAMKIALSMILRRHRLTVQPGVRIDRTVRVMMSPRYGLPTSIHPPDGAFQAVKVHGNINDMVDMRQVDPQPESSVIAFTINRPASIGKTRQLDSRPLSRVAAK